MTVQRPMRFKVNLHSDPSDALTQGCRKCVGRQTLMILEKKCEIVPIINLFHRIYYFQEIKFCRIMAELFAWVKCSQFVTPAAVRSRHPHTSLVNLKTKKKT